MPESNHPSWKDASKASASSASGSSAQASLAAVTKRIRLAEIAAGRNPHSVKLLAVSKTKPIEMISALFEAGQRAFGENYLQEALEKINALKASNIEWHFIGAMQSNKTRAIAENFAWVHSIASPKIAERLSRQRPNDMAPLNCCIQVNIDHEESKAGVSEQELEKLARQIAALPGLQLRGLMCIPAKSSGDASFERMQNLFQHMQLEFPEMDTLSMGMSADLEQAIQYGSTMIRIGTAIFGARE